MSWGITPGKSSFQEASAILEPLSSLSDFTSLFPSPGNISPLYTDQNFMIYTRVAYLLSENGIVGHISFNAEAHKSLEKGDYENVFGVQWFGEHVKDYELSSILSNQGIPNTVMFSTLAGFFSQGKPPDFNILLLYPDQGLLVHYTAQRQLGSNKITGAHLMHM